MHRKVMRNGYAKARMRVSEQMPRVKDPSTKNTAPIEYDAAALITLGRKNTSRMKPGPNEAMWTTINAPGLATADSKAPNRNVLRLNMAWSLTKYLVSIHRM